MKSHQGKPLKDDVERELLSLSSNREQLSFSEIEQALEESYCTNTLIKYLKLLVARGLMEEKPVKIQGKYFPRYSITKKGQKNFETSIQDDFFSTIRTFGTMASKIQIDSAEAIRLFRSKEVGGIERAKELIRQYEKGDISLEIDDEPEPVVRKKKGVEK